jgi:hypothetical protein
MNMTAIGVVTSTTVAEQNTDFETAFTELAAQVSTNEPTSFIRCFSAG